MDFNYDIDKEDMRSILRNFAEQIEKGIELGSKIKPEGDFNKIFILGMGGSALPGDLLKSYLYDEETPVFVSKDYSIPKYIDRNSIVFAISYSGNTEETIAAYRDVLKTKATVIAISSGGKLAEISKMNGSVHIKVPSGIQPRQAFGYQFFPILAILQNTGLIKNKDSEIKDTISTLKKDIYEENGKELAIKLQGKIPLIYSSTRLGIIAEKWKISFNENAKTQAFYNLFPEFNHNELNGYVNLNGNFYAVIIKDENDHPRIKKRMTIVKDLIKSKGVDVIEMVIRGDSLLAKIISGMYIADWVAYYTALLMETDPTPVNLIEDFKKRLKE